MGKVIYLKRVDDYDEIIKNKIKLPLTFKRIIYLYKNIFNKITEKKNDNLNIWIFPFKEKVSDNKLEKILVKQIKKRKLSDNTKVVVSDNLIKHNIVDILKKYEIEIINGKMIKKILIFKALDLICEIQKKELNSREITILADENSKINNYIIKKLALQVKTLKIVSKKIYKFKILEEELYKNYGIAIQFSNSYKKSLLKSEIIINLDFNEMEINEYEINNKAIIINTEESLKIKTKLFNGIIINLYKIKFSKELRDIFSRNGLLHRYNNLILYESIMNLNENEYSELLEKDKVRITNFIGNNGIINKKEFKIIAKSIDKS